MIMVRKKSTSKRIIAIVFALVALIAAIAVLYNPAQRYFAIERAKNYRPSNWCSEIPTRAYHKDTDQYYTFPNNCIPLGWEEAPETEPN